MPCVLRSRWSANRKNRGAGGPGGGYLCRAHRSGTAPRLNAKSRYIQVDLLPRL